MRTWTINNAINHEECTQMVVKKIIKLATRLCLSVKEEESVYLAAAMKSQGRHIISGLETDRHLKL